MDEGILNNLEKFNSEVKNCSIKYLKVLVHQGKEYVVILFTIKVESSEFICKIAIISNDNQIQVQIKGINAGNDQINVLINSKLGIVLYTQSEVFYTSLQNFPFIKSTLAADKIYGDRNSEIACIKFIPTAKSDELYILLKNSLSLMVFDLSCSLAAISTIWLPISGFTTFCFSTMSTDTPLVVYSMKYGFYCVNHDNVE